MVGTDAHSNVDFFLGLISLIGPIGLISLIGLMGLIGLIREAGELLLHLNDRLEDVGIVVGVFTLQHAYQTLKAHTGVDDIHRQRLQRAVGLAVELHEHDVPYLDNLRVVFVDQFAPSRTVLLLFLGTAVDVNLGAGSAGTCVAHLPEVVVFVAIDDVVCGHVLSPELGSLVVAGDILLG